MAKGNKRSQWLALLLLIGIVGGFGTWNYRRNVEAEALVPRPYRSYSDADLATLTDAYQQELDAFTRRYEATTGRKLPSADGELLGDQIRQFEKVQQARRSTRELARQIIDREASLGEIKRETRVRVGEGTPMAILKKAFDYRG